MESWIAFKKRYFYTYPDATINQVQEAYKTGRAEVNPITGLQYVKRNPTLEELPDVLKSKIFGFAGPKASVSGQRVSKGIARATATGAEQACNLDISNEEWESFTTDRENLFNFRYRIGNKVYLFRFNPALWTRNMDEAELRIAAVGDAIIASRIRNAVIASNTKKITIDLRTCRYMLQKRLSCIKKDKDYVTKEITKLFMQRFEPLITPLLDTSTFDDFLTYDDVSIIDIPPIGTAEYAEYRLLMERWIRALLLDDFKATTLSLDNLLVQDIIGPEYFLTVAKQIYEALLINIDTSKCVYQGKLVPSKVRLGAYGFYTKDRGAVAVDAYGTKVSVFAIETKAPKNKPIYIKDTLLDTKDGEGLWKTTLRSLTKEDEVWYVDRLTLRELIRIDNNIDRACPYTDNQMTQATMLAWLEPIYKPFITTNSLRELLLKPDIDKSDISEISTDSLKFLVDVTYIICIDTIPVEENKGRIRVELSPDKIDTIIDLLEWVKITLE